MLYGSIHVRANDWVDRDTCAATVHEAAPLYREPAPNDHIETYTCQFAAFHTWLEKIGSLNRRKLRHVEIEFAGGHMGDGYCYAGDPLSRRTIIHGHEKGHLFKALC